MDDDAEIPSAWRHHAVHLIGGCWSGACSDLLLHPMSTLRARLMVQPERTKLSLFGYARQVVAREGGSALFRGIGLVLAGTIPGSALFYAGYESAKSLLSEQSGVSSDVKHLVSGGVATLCGSSIFQPLEVVVQKAQTGACGPEVKGSFNTLLYVLRTSGVRGLYRGYMAAQLTWLPYFSIYFVAYERLKAAAMARLGAKSEHEVWSATFLLCGASAGAFAGALTCPVDVVKTRIQVGSLVTTTSGVAAAAPPLPSLSIAGTVRDLWRTEGCRGFTRGMSARVMWLAPGSAVGITAYEWAKRTAAGYIL